MTNEELKNIIIQQIDSYANNGALLNKTLSYVSDIAGVSSDGLIIKGNRDEDDIADEIKSNLNLVVPVVCDDMFEYSTPDNRTISLKEYVCELYADKKYASATQIIKTNYYYGVTLLEKVKGSNQRNSLYQKFDNAVNDGKIRLKESVRQFLLNSNFPVIITTFGFKVIERELGLESDHHASVWYNPKGRNDLPFVEKGGNSRIYHIFGGDNQTCWVYNEDTLLSFIHSLHSGDYGAKNLYYYLRTQGNEVAKSLLVLGSTLPNWLFRFFIYPMFEDGRHNGNYWLSLEEIDKGLDLFLDANAYIGQTNLRQENKIETLIRKATTDNIKKDAIITYPKIFISYKREEEGTREEGILNRVITILDRQVHGHIWIDKEEVDKGGTRYWVEIKNAVNECDIFVPLITKRYLEEYRDEKYRNIDEKILEMKDFIAAEGDNANDTDYVEQMNPVVREAVYAIKYKKPCCPIAILDKEANINGGTLDKIFKTPSEGLHLPKCFFNAITNLVHNDDIPHFFNFPKVK